MKAEPVNPEINAFRQPPNAAEYKTSALLIGYSVLDMEIDIDAPQSSTVNDLAAKKPEVLAAGENVLNRFMAAYGIIDPYIAQDAYWLWLDTGEKPKKNDSEAK